MTLSDGSTVNVVYAADGRKLRERVISSGTTVIRNYSGNCIFEGSVLKMVLFEGGYAQMSGNTPTYMFFLTDHLGSVRVVADENGSVRQVNQYYPYGELIEDANMAEGTSSDNRYRFTGKELATETGLYDFIARYLATSMGRFTTIDPLAEKYPSISPYAYCAGDPVNYVDLFGLTSYNVNGETRDIQDGRDEIVEVSKLQYARLNRMWNNDKSKQYNRLNKKIRDTTGYINADGDFVLAASFCINLPSYTEYMSRDTDSTLFSVESTIFSSFLKDTSKKMYDEKRGTWIDRKGTIRKMSFNGNGYTGGRVKFAKAASKTMKRYSDIIGIIDTIKSFMSAYANRNSLPTAITNIMSPAVSTVSAFIPYAGPLLSLAWSAYGEYWFYTHIANGFYQDDETD